MSDKEKQPAINYTSRQFGSIKADLVNYAKRYYPDEFRDFSANSFGSLMLDSVAYIGDILSFYLDYQTNESFLSTAIEYNNILKLAREFGYKPKLSPSSYGTLTFFILVPAINGAPDFDYAPILKKGSKFKSKIGKMFTLLEDVNFADLEKTETVVGEVNTDTGAPSSYAIRARGQAVSGQLSVKNSFVGDYERFKRVEVIDNNISEIVSVTDSEGNKFYEVDYLTQNTIFVPIINRNEDRTTVVNVLKPIAVPRRFITIVESDKTTLQFGFGNASDEEKVLDPKSILMNEHGKTYITDDSFDPATLVKTDKLGVSPYNTTLSIIYRTNTADNTNAGINTITVVANPILEFTNETTLSSVSRVATINSLEVVNEEAFVGDIPFPNIDEIKMRAYGTYSMQNRIVTREDFIAATYNMPANFGAIKKVSVQQDNDSFNQRNINLYILSENNLGHLTIANNTLKSNLKTWISNYKMINDTVDILDAKIINLKIFFRAAGYPNINKYSALDKAKRDLQLFFGGRKNYEIGEPFKISDIYSVLKNSPLILDVLEVDVRLAEGADYATSNFDVENARGSDGRTILCPNDTCFELKYPDTDIIGNIV